MKTVLAILALLLALGVQPVRAQALFPLRGLEFGALQPGVARTISPHDPDAASLFMLASRKFSLRIITPPAMLSLQGASLPLEFGPGDAVIEWLGGQQQSLTPGTTTTVHARGQLAIGTLYIGGTAQPTLMQGAGSYSATIVVQISDPGS